MIKSGRVFAAGWILGVALLLIGLGDTVLSAGPDSTVVIGAKPFPESRLLAEIMAQVIEAKTDLTVDRRFGLGGTMVCFGAISSGEIDLYPEYTGTGLLSILQLELGDDRSPDFIYKRVKQEFGKQFQIDWLGRFGFSNGYVLAAHPRLGLQKISDLKGVQDQIRVRFQHEFLDRADGYPAIRSRYGIEFSDVQGMEHGVAYRALDDDLIDLMDAYSTDGMLEKYDVTLLDDDLSVFPPYDAAPLVRRSTLRQHPELGEALAKLQDTISQPEMVAMNHQMLGNAGAAEIASSFLVAEGLIDPSQAVRVDWRDKLAGFWVLLKQHLFLTLTATILATLVGVALGLVVVRYPKRLAGPVLGIVGILQTIPSLAMLAFMIPLLGIGWVPAVTALFLYALLPIVRNTYTGIASVPTELKDAGKGMGMTPMQLLFQLELPLATQTIMAGIRTALVISVGTATLGSFIGAGGFGDPINTGLQQNDNMLILSGAIPAAVLALVCDFLMARIEKRLGPRGV